ncbi:hypothetical protein [uncultured Microbulbifer sp.]|uniref:hypothetical protein n=1 Tax=uncultured Microbulbifer sp. TaxID=348147 RepID=UPI00262F231C|nr:hypothetical protein [uncultured Microbulbifer sp.]
MSNIIRVLWQPNRTLSRFACGEISVIPLFVLVLLVDLMVAISLMPYMKESISRAVTDSGQGAMGYESIVLSISVITATVTPILILAFVAILMLLLVMIFDGKTSYSSIFGMLLAASIPALIARAGRGGAYVARLTDNPSQGVTSLGYYVPEFGDGHWNQLLNGVDILDLWTFVLVVFGLHVVTDLKRAPSYGIALFIWGGLQLVYFRALMLTEAPL